MILSIFHLIFVIFTSNSFLAQIEPQGLLRNILPTLSIDWVPSWVSGSPPSPPPPAVPTPITPPCCTCQYHPCCPPLQTPEESHCDRQDHQQGTSSGTSLTVKTVPRGPTYQPVAAISEAIVQATMSQIIGASCSILLFLFASLAKCQRIKPFLKNLKRYRRTILKYIIPLHVHWNDPVAEYREFPSNDAEEEESFYSCEGLSVGGSDSPSASANAATIPTIQVHPATPVLASAVNPFSEKLASLHQAINDCLTVASQPLLSESHHENHPATGASSSRIDTAEAQLAALREENARQTDEIDQLRALLTQKDLEKKSLAEKFKKVDEEACDLRATNFDLEVDIDKQKSEIAVMRKGAVGIALKMRDLKKELANGEQERVDLAERLAEAESQLEDEDEDDDDDDGEEKGEEEESSEDVQVQNANPDLSRRNNDPSEARVAELEKELASVQGNFKSERQLWEQRESTIVAQAFKLDSQLQAANQHIQGLYTELDTERHNIQMALQGRQEMQLLALGLQKMLKNPEIRGIQGLPLEVPSGDLWVFQDIAVDELRQAAVMREQAQAAMAQAQAAQAWVQAQQSQAVATPEPGMFSIQEQQSDGVSSLHFVQEDDLPRSDIQPMEHDQLVTGFRRLDVNEKDTMSPGMDDSEVMSARASGRDIKGKGREVTFDLANQRAARNQEEFQNDSPAIAERRQLDRSCKGNPIRAPSMLEGSSSGLTSKHSHSSESAARSGSSRNSHSRINDSGSPSQQHRDLLASVVSKSGRSTPQDPYPRPVNPVGMDTPIRTDTRKQYSLRSMKRPLSERNQGEERSAKPRYASMSTPPSVRGNEENTPPLARHSDSPRNRRRRRALVS